MIKEVENCYIQEVSRCEIVLISVGKEYLVTDLII